MEFIKLSGNRYLIKGSNGVIISEKDLKNYTKKELKNGDNSVEKAKSPKKSNRKSEHTRD